MASDKKVLPSEVHVGSRCEYWEIKAVKLLSLVFFKSKSSDYSKNKVIGLTDPVHLEGSGYTTFCLYIG